MFENKRILVFGVANERSIAWGIVQAMQQRGARFAITYAGDAFEKRVRPLAESINAEILMPCDVTDDAQVDAVFDTVARQWGGIDVLVHAVAYANREDLEGRYADTSREGFKTALEISAYSLVAVSRRAEPLMKEQGGSIITLSYYGAEKVVSGYNVMGVAKAALEASVRYLAADLGPANIRVNAISAGPIKTLAASGIRGFKTILHVVEEKAPLRRNVTQEDVANTALFLCSDMGSGITGETLHVDCGYNILGL